MLLACAVGALVWANSPWADSYFGMVNTRVGVTLGDRSVQMSLGHWIADGLMAIFFFVVGHLSAGRLGILGGSGLRAPRIYRLRTRL